MKGLNRVASWLWIWPLVVVLLAGCASQGEIEDSETLQAEAEAEAAELMSGGDAAARSGKLNDALGLYARAVSQAPSADLWLRVGAVHQRLHNVHEAGVAYRSALELDPEDARAYEELGLIYVSANKKELARAHLRITTPPLPTIAGRWKSDRNRRC
jgi:tetratricopeptide (TPR) repeat protein